MTTLKAQLKVPLSSTLKVMGFNANVDIIWKTVPTEVLVTTDPPPERGSGEYAGLFDPQSEPVLQLPWHKGVLRVFEACASGNAHPSGLAKKDQPSLWTGNYLKSR